MRDGQALADAATWFRALADPTRLAIIAALRNRELCVDDLVRNLCATQPKVSRHLAYLRRRKIVDTRRDRRFIYYRLAPMDDLRRARVFDAVRQWLIVG